MIQIGLIIRATSMCEEAGSPGHGGGRCSLRLTAREAGGIARPLMLTYLDLHRSGVALSLSFSLIGDDIAITYTTHRARPPPPSSNSPNQTGRHTPRHDSRLWS